MGALSLLLATAASVVGLQAHSSPYGNVLFDGRGYALYAFTADTATKSNCRGSCLKAWPPFLGTARALKGVDRSKIGSLRGQVTYAGHPLYYYAADPKGRILCQNVKEFGGLWLVVRPSGKLVR